MRSIVLFSLLIAVNLALPIPASHAQQGTRPRTASPSNRGYFGRLQNQSSMVSTASGYSRLQSGLEQTHSNGDAFRDVPDPLRPYSTDDGGGSSKRPYARTPVVSPLEKERPAPAVSRNYFPGLRPAQGTNRNGGARCVPGRHALLSR